ncbi:unnamed protein product [Rotaria sp. Silwood2]|nr:unnamed protein product [Rotaria sp. Silwood2]CAF3423170.1 unnamed protein product [Rotaria sp. Silwood2]CAF4465386.1 unnamed protein product [Rotaria sp. Silwood2]CAF4536782.1 unnamed protein product [Rotaria sp. Silwood2]
MGNIYYKKKDYPTALSYLRTTLRIEEQALGVNHPDLANTHNNISYILKDLSDYEQAFFHIQQAIEIASRTWEPHDDRLKLFNNHRDTFLWKILPILMMKIQDCNSI